MKGNTKQGFTLLEIIIVIIIVGVLASLALPRFFNTVEYSRSTEAFTSMAALRGALERCFLQGGNATVCSNANGFDVENPSNAPNAHFTYVVSASSTTAYSLVATRNTRDNGVTTSGITLTNSGTEITRSGVGAFSNVR